METRSAVLKMINAVPGSWETAATHLGMTTNALRNRVYEAKGQSLATVDQLSLQELSNTTHFAEAIAAASGGAFVKLPEIGELGAESIQLKFNQIYAALGDHFKLFLKSIEDNNINSLEQKEIVAHGAELHRGIEQLQALMFALYCNKTQTVRLVPAQSAEIMANG